jgi:hypothetical protein
MMNKFFLFFFTASVAFIAPSCNSNKIACPTYADSFPDKKKKSKKPEPQIPKASKAKSSVMPGGTRDHHTQ